MLGEEFDLNRARKGGLWTFAILIAVKAFRTWALCEGYSILHGYDYPVFLYTFFVIAGSSLFFLGFQQPWHGRKTLRSTQFVRLGLYSILLILNFIFWNIGLKYYGPIRTILSSDHGDIAFAMIFTTLFNFSGGKSKNVNTDKMKGALVLVVAYLLIFWIDPATTAETTAIDPQQDPIGEHYFNIGWISIPETKIGGICLFFAVCLTLVRKNLSTKFHTELGGSKRLYALSLTTAACLMSPAALYQYANAEFSPAMPGFSTFLGFVAIIVFSVVAEFYVESIVQNQLEVSTIAKTSLITSFIVACFFELAWDIGSVSFITLLCFACTVYGFHIILQKKAVDRNDLPVYGIPAHMRGINLFSFQFIRLSLRQILEGRESRRIFLYLCCNLMFMFIEALYGFLTNSLGLISDACHMLFDCTALLIGLYAAIIANWEPNQLFSYGYGRVEVLSGFINGIFLIFIAFAVLLESVERVLHPQEINTDKLLLVSTLGLCVNLVGVFAFHDLHGGGGDDHGHSHSHGHGHGHGHGHKEGKKEKDDSHNDNIWGVYLHIIADTLGSVGVIISSLCVQYLGWTSADPICSFCISALIFVGVIPLLKTSATTLLQCTPTRFEKKFDKCLKKLMTLEGVISYSNPHIWQQNKDFYVGTISVQIKNDANQQEILAKVTKSFTKKGVKNLTVEITKLS